MTTSSRRTGRRSRSRCPPARRRCCNWRPGTSSATCPRTRWSRGSTSPSIPTTRTGCTNPGSPTASIEPVTGQLPIARTSAYIAPVSAAGLQESLLFGRLQAWIPVDTSGFDYADAGRAADPGATGRRRAGRPQRLRRSELPQRPPGGDRPGDRKGHRGVVAARAQRLRPPRRAARGVRTRSAVGGRPPPPGARARLGARGGRAAASRRDGARGPAALAAGIRRSRWRRPRSCVPGRVGIEAWVLPAAVALAPPVLFATMTSGRDLRAPRSDLRLRARSRSRWIAEVAVVGLAALSLFLLARRGLVESSDSVGIDPLLAATPLLLAAAVCIGVLRLYPLPLLGVQRGLRRRRGAAGVLGAARAIRDPSLGFAAALALVVGITIVVFSTVMSTTLRSGLEQAAQDERRRRHPGEGPRPRPGGRRGGGGHRGRRDARSAIAVQSGVAARDRPRPDRGLRRASPTPSALHAARPEIPRLDSRGRRPHPVAHLHRLGGSRRRRGSGPRRAPGGPGRRAASRRAAGRHPALGAHRLVVRRRARPRGGSSRSR